MAKLHPEDLEAAKAAFEKAKGDAGETASLFEVVDALRALGIETETDQLYEENGNWDVTFEKFCEIYANRKDEHDKAELLALVQESFNVLSGQQRQQGVVDVGKLQNIFKFFEFDIEPEDFLGRAGFDLTSSLLFEDYLTIFELGGIRQ